MGMNTGSSGALNASINVTPLVDVVLVLLIIFMVVTPLLQLGYTIDVPGRDRGPVKPAPPIVLGLTASDCPLLLASPGAVPLGSLSGRARVLQEAGAGVASEGPLASGGAGSGCRVRLGEASVMLADLPASVAALFDRRVSDRVLYLAAEEPLNYENVLGILDVAKSAAGSDIRIAITTEPPTRPEPVAGESSPVPVAPNPPSFQ